MPHWLPVRHGEGPAVLVGSHIGKHPQVLVPAAALWVSHGYVSPVVPRVWVSHDSVSPFLRVFHGPMGVGFP